MTPRRGSKWRGQKGNPHPPFNESFTLANHAPTVDDSGRGLGVRRAESESRQGHWGPGQAQSPRLNARWISAPGRAMMELTRAQLRADRRVGGAEQDPTTAGAGCCSGFVRRRQR